MTTTTVTADALATTVTAMAEAVAEALPLELEVGFATPTGNDRHFASSRLDPTARAVSMQLAGAQDVVVTITLATRAMETMGTTRESLVADLEPALAAAAGSLDPTVYGALALAGIDEVNVETPADAWAVPVEDSKGTAVVVTLGVQAEQAAAEPTPAAGAAAAPAHQFESLDAPAVGGRVSRSLDLLHDVEMSVTVELGRTRMTVREILGLTPGTVVELDRAAGAPVDVVVNGTLIARGEVVVIDEEFGIRVTEIVAGADEMRA